MSDLAIIRPFSSEADFAACVALQRRTWGDDFRELVPPAMLLVAQKVGGVAAGAFRGDELAGFVYGLTGVRDGELVHWSHMLAVAPTYRDRGIGRRLKYWQRDQVLALGVTRMFWTFDPLVARNAYLNLAVLGTRVVEYRRNLYGENPMSRTDSVIGSDRFVVEWAVAETRHARSASAHAPGGGAVRRPGGAGPERDRATITPVTPERPDVPEVHIAVPPDIQALKEQRPDEARTWREVTRAAFEHYLAAGYRVEGVRRSTVDRDDLHYVLHRHGD